MDIPGLEREIRIEVVARSDVGRRRSENQDAFLLGHFRDGRDGSPPTLGQGPSVEASPEVFPLGPKGALIAVADGMGGAAEGALASRMALASLGETLAGSWVPDRITTPDLFAENLLRAAEEANGQVFHASRSPDREGMGTTLTAVGILGAFAYVAQVGDSRAYLFRLGILTRLTRDQSVVQELVDSGQMTREEAEQSRQRNVLLQALGVDEGVSVEMTYQALRRGDLLLLCSDGLHGTMEDEAIAQALTTTDDIGTAADELVESANRLGGPDNITVVVARFAGDGLPLPGGAAGASV